MYTCKLQIKIGDLKFFNFFNFCTEFNKIIILYNCINRNKNESFQKIHFPYNKNN